MTDLEYCPIDLSKITPTDVIVECNYCEDMVDMEADNIRHKLLGHMGLKACKDFIKHVASIELKNVILCHRGLVKRHKIVPLSIGGMIATHIHRRFCYCLSFFGLSDSNICSQVSRKYATIHKCPFQSPIVKPFLAT